MEPRNGECYHPFRRWPFGRFDPAAGPRPWGRVIKSTKAQVVFAWGFVAVVWVACALHIFSKNPEIPLGSAKGLRFFIVDTGLAVFALGGVHYYLQLGLMKILDRIDIDPGNKSSMMRLNRAGLLMIFLEIVAIYQVASFVFQTFIL